MILQLVYNWNSKGYLDLSYKVHHISTLFKYLCFVFSNWILPKVGCFRQPKCERYSTECFLVLLTIESRVSVVMLKDSNLLGCSLQDLPPFYTIFVTCACYICHKCMHMQVAILLQKWLLVSTYFLQSTPPSHRLNFCMVVYQFDASSLVRFGTSV